MQAYYNYNKKFCIMEIKLLSALAADRAAFDKISPYIEEGDFSDQGEILVKHMSAYYENDPKAQSVDRDVLLSVLEREMQNPKHFDTFKGIVGRLDPKVSVPNITQEFLLLKKEKIGQQLGGALISGVKPANIDELMDRYVKYSTATSLEEDKDEYHNYSIRELVQGHYTPEKMVKVIPLQINERLDGGVMPGHHILIFGRPNSGKSAFAINMAVGFIKQGRKVLYVCNEDPTVSLLLRFVSRLTGWDKYAIIKNPDEAQKEAEKKGYGNLIMRGLAPGTIRELNSLIEEHKPDVIVVDQLRNLSSRGTENNTTRLETVVTGVRNLLKRHNIIGVSVTQAGESAANKLVLTMEDIDGSKTGIQGQVDVMVGIGFDEKMKAASQRMVTICKNKLAPIEDFFPVVLNPGLSKVQSL